MDIKKAEDFPAPIDFPLTYPGRRPKNSYVISDGNVLPVYFDPKERGSSGSTSGGNVLINDSESIRIDHFLKRKGKAPLEERFAVIGYGSNPVPGQVIKKFGDDVVMPIVKGSLSDSDIAYNLISARGYAFAELLTDGKKGDIDIMITFLDPHQLKVMNQTEPNYDLSFMPNDIRLESGESIRGEKEYSVGLFYAGNKKIWLPKDRDSPLYVNETTQEDVLDKTVKDMVLSKLGIRDGKDLSYRVRFEGEKKDGIKRMIQDMVEIDPRSIIQPPVTSVGGLTPPKTFGDNNYR